MRADRLLAELMLLQTHGKVSASRMAATLEVSERTIYRDMLALSTSGVPVYADQGVNGGFRLVDGYRTQLTGLNSEELRVLFALNIPSLFDGLGLDVHLSNAMRKLAASISTEREGEMGWMQQRFLFDPVPWQMDDTKQHQERSRLQQIQQAVWNDQMLSIDLQMFPHGELNDLWIEPYSLVSKDHLWYVIAKRNGSFQPYSLDEILAVHQLENVFERDRSFNLQSFWSQWLALRKSVCGSYPVIIQVAEKNWWVVSRQLARFIRETGCVDQEQNRIVKLNFLNLPEARSRLLTMGGAVKILNPEPLRLSVQDFAGQIVAVYQELIRAP